MEPNHLLIRYSVLSRFYRLCSEKVGAIKAPGEPPSPLPLPRARPKAPLATGAVRPASAPIAIALLCSSPPGARAIATIPSVLASEGRISQIKIAPCATTCLPFWGAIPPCRKSREPPGSSSSQRSKHKSHARNMAHCRQFEP